MATHDCINNIGSKLANPHLQCHSLLQQQIRMYIESEIARAIPTAIPSAPQQQRDDFEIA